MNDTIFALLADHVERTLAGLPVGSIRRQQMREELLAHLVVVFEEEFARLKSEDDALVRTLARFGASDEVNRDIRAVVPVQERIWHHIFAHKERLMKWLLVTLGVFGFVVGTGFICPAFTQILTELGVIESNGLHHYNRGEMIAFALALLLLGVAITLSGVWAFVRGAQRFRTRRL